MSALCHQRSGVLLVAAPRSGGVAGHGSGRGEVSTGASDSAWLLELHTTYLRPAPSASAGTGREVPAAHSHPHRPAREAGLKEEN
jgi:hypothetical protein